MAASRRTGFTEGDLNQIKDYVQMGVTEGLRPIQTMVAEHEMILRGPDKVSGLVKESAELKSWRERWASRIIGYGAGAGLVSGVIFYILDLFRNHGGKP